MRLGSVLPWTLCAVLLLNMVPARAFETDQYNLPPVPLADIGDEVSQYAEENLVAAVEKLNREIGVRTACLESAERSSKCGPPEKIRDELRYLRSEDAVAKEIYKRLGDGVIPFTRVGFWVDTHKFKGRPARYRTSYWRSIHLTAPFNYLTISPTVNLYGAQFGTDKIAHLFQQGYDYYKIYRREMASGASNEDAVEKAVRFGQKTERTYFGTWVSGIFSNADLAANYAGLKFYIGLTRDVSAGEETIRAFLRLKSGAWILNDEPGSSPGPLKPFISMHFNEALNPSKFFNLASFRDVVRRKVRKHSCKQWFERDPNLSKADLEAQTRSLERWFGEDYGFSRSDHFITIANTCFNEKGEKGS